jgi:Ca2+:H+ antiporter
MTSSPAPMPKSAWIFPIVAVLFFAVASALHFEFAASLQGVLFAIVLLVILFGTVFAAVHHAEVIAHRIGEPYGTLLLTLSVTIIEVTLIATMMVGGREASTLARDTVFAAVMIVCNGLVGICIFIGSLRYREQDIQVSGANLYLSVLFTIATITLILPNYTLTTPGPFFSEAQLEFISVVTILLYGVFLYIQTIRHRDYFVSRANQRGSGAAIWSGTLVLTLLLLIVSLVAVVLLAKKFSAVVEAGTAAMGASPAFAGVIVALLILLPESVAAVSAARKDDLQKSINLALGSSLSTIGLTVPAVAVAAYAFDKQLALGLSPQNSVELLLTFILSMLTFVTGRTNILFGLIHMVVFAVFLLLVFVP